MTGTVIMNLTDSYDFFRENAGRTLGDLKLEYLWGGVSFVIDI